MIPLFKIPMDAQDAKDSSLDISGVLSSGYVGEGPVSARFEAEFSRYVGGRCAVVSSGTAALHLALVLCGVKPGDEVISTPMTCTATNAAIYHTGARIVWADVNPKNGLMDPADAARRVTSKTSAIVAVSLWGALPDYLPLSRLGIPLIADSAHGPYYVPSGPDIVCWSFQAIKTLTTIDGGALYVRDQVALERAKRLRWFGFDRSLSADFRCSQEIEDIGYKYQLNDVLATVGSRSLSGLDDRRRRAHENARYYDREIDHGIERSAHGSHDDFWVYVILVDERERFQMQLEGRGVASSLVHRRNDTLPCFRDSARSLPGVDRYASRHLAIPVGHWLSMSERAHVAKSVNEVRELGATNASEKSYELQNL